MSAPSLASIAGHHTDRQRPPYRVDINGVRFEIHERFRTGAQLKELAGIPSENHLFLEVPGDHDDEQIMDDFAVPMQNGLRFYDVPVGNLGAR